MKIVHFSKYYYPYKGGIESIVKDLAEGQAQHGHQVTVLCFNSFFTPVMTETQNNVKIIRTGSFGKLFSLPISPIYLIAALYLSVRHDIIHIHGPNPLAEIAGILICWRKIFYTHHSDIVRQKILGKIYSPIQKFFLHKIKNIIIPTKNHILFSKSIAPFQEKAIIIPFGIKTNHLQIVDPLKNKQILQKYDKFVLFVGRLVEYKGLKYLIQAMQDIDINLLIIGNGPEKNNLQQLTKGLRLEHMIFFLGHLESKADLAAYYQTCLLFCLPSIYPSENFGIVQLEAMFCQKPVIATNLQSGVPAVGEPNITSILVTPGNASELQKAIKKIANNSELQQKMGMNGKDRFMQYYQYNQMITSHLQAYSK